VICSTAFQSRGPPVRRRVQAERDGLFEKHEYIEALPDDHPVRRNQNVFVFAMSCASFELGQFLSIVVAPGRVADHGGQMYRFATGTIDHDEAHPPAACPFSSALLARGDRVGVDVTGARHAANAARANRAVHQRRLAVRFLRTAERLRARLAVQPV
jgi:hypothetical protein